MRKGFIGPKNKRKYNLKLGEDGLTTSQRWRRKLGPDGLSNSQRRNQRLGEDGLTYSQRHEVKIGEDGLTNNQRYNALKGEDGLTKKQRRNLRAKYNLTPKDFNRMVAEQGGLCVICERQGKKLCVDHDHDTGKVRSLLCADCNMAIGLLGDSAGRLMVASEYLKKHGKV